MFHIFLANNAYATAATEDEVRRTILDIDCNARELTPTCDDTEGFWELLVPNAFASVFKLPDDTQVVTQIAGFTEGSPTWEAAGRYYTGYREFEALGHLKFEYSQDNFRCTLRMIEEKGEYGYKSLLVASGVDEADTYANFARYSKPDEDEPFSGMWPGDSFEAIGDWIARKCSECNIPLVGSEEAA